jgi:hypothetical protein
MDRVNKIKNPRSKDGAEDPGRAKQKGTGGKSTKRPQRAAQGSANNKTRKTMQEPGRKVPRAGQSGKRDRD